MAGGGLLPKTREEAFNDKRKCISSEGVMNFHEKVRPVHEKRAVTMQRQGLLMQRARQQATVQCY
jgi:hypothetical protein